MLGKISLKLFGKFLEPYIGSFDNLKIQLRQAQMKTEVLEYVCDLILLSLITFIVSMLLGSFFIALTTFHPYYSYTLAIIVSVLLSGFVFVLGYYYPSIKVKNMRNKIEKSLPFTTIYMCTIASSETNPLEIFKIASMRGGEIGKEFQRIYRDVEMLGMDLPAAISKAANRTPSPRFSELLWGISSIITRGGNLESYLVDKSKDFMNQYRRSLNDYSNQITFYTEIYITLIIVGTLFFIVLSSIMGPLVGGNILFIQTMLVFFFIPAVSIGFIVLLRGLSPVE
jgi:flagellar protein FlaJ